MFGIGLPELIIILIVALIVFGPKKLPDLAKSLGKGMAEFKKATDEFKSNIQTDISSIEDEIKDVKRDLTEEIYNPEVASQPEIQAASETVPPELPPPSAEQGAASSSFMEDFERGQVELAATPESPPSEVVAAQTTSPPKEEGPPITPKESA